jgi:hypothetical protein
VPRRALVVLALACTTSVAAAQEEPSPPEEDPGPTEVTVRGGRSAPLPKADSLSQKEVRQLPGAFGDPWRAIEIMPGFTPVLSGLPYFYVRGAPPGNVGFYFDGVRVPYLFHFGLGPAVVQPALIAKTDVWAGGYPAALGRWAGGVVDATAMPPSEHFHADGGVRAIDAGGLLEVPFANGKGSATFGGRYSYTAALFTLLQSDTTLDYRDYQTRVSYALGERDVVSVLAFGAYDLATQKEQASASSLAAAAGANDPSRFQAGRIERVLFASEFHRVDARWDHDFASGGTARVAATAGYDRTRVEARRAADDVLTGLRARIEQPLGKVARIRAGGDVTVDQYGGDPLPQFADDDDVVERQRHIFVSRTDWAAGLWLDTVLVPQPWLEITPGIRFDAFGSGSAQADAVDPRLAARFAITKSFRIVHAYGIASQPPSTPILLPGITIANLEGGLQRSVQTSAGVEVDLPEDITASATGFHDAFYNLNDALGTAQVELIDIEKSDALLAKTRGSAYGLEVGVKRKVTRRLSGLVTYTLSRSIRTTPAREFVSAYDRTHVGNVVASYDLGRNWRAGARYVFYSGIPNTPTTPAFPGQVVGTPPARTPPFQRLDLRVEKRWLIGDRGAWVALVFEALNATLSKEITGYACGKALAVPGAPAPSPTCSERVIGPISVPSIGVEGGI